MSTIAIKPAFSDLYKFIGQVDDYPVSVGQLISLARRLKAPAPVVDFYKSFSADQVFESEEELTSRSEQVDIMRHEEAEMPEEIERGPEDY